MDWNVILNALEAFGEEVSIAIPGTNNNIDAVGSIAGDHARFSLTLVVRK